jgi:transglutaminase-like putative cysteine protease
MVPRAETSVERFFQLALLGLVASGYLAVAGSGYLDTPTVTLTAIGLLVRTVWICGLIRLEISERATTLITLGYTAFFALDYLLLSRDFLSATVHLLFFLAVMKILTARTNRDFLYTAIIAFLELLAAAILSVNFNFLLFLSLYLLFAIAALTSAEIRRSSQKSTNMARSGPRRIAPRLALLATLVTGGILVMTAGLFFILPRTAEAAFARLVPHRIYLPGFANQVTLGEIGEIKISSRTVMHIRVYSTQPVGALKWRGGALTEFDGKRWTNPRTKQDFMQVENDHVDLVPIDQRIPGVRINYHVDLEPLDQDALFFAGVPEILDVHTRTLFRSEGAVYRLGHPLPQGLRYDAYGLLEPRPETSPPILPAPVLSLAARERSLQLPVIDRRIPELARTLATGAHNDLERVRAIEKGLRTGYRYTLELPDREFSDPLAHFLFTRKKGHCEYFASAMAVMLRSIGIPARLATGFQSGIYNPVSELWLVRASDAHSWVEAWIPGRGWTTFDPTPPDPNVRGSLAFLTSLTLYLDAAETFWQQWVVTYDIVRQGTLAGRIEQGAQRVGLRWFDSVVMARSMLSRYVAAGASRFGVLLLAAAVGLVFLWLLIRLLVRRLSIRQRVARIRRGEASVADATLLYRRMLHILQRRGYQKPPWFTPSEFAESLPVSELATAAREFTATYNALRFGGHTQAATRLSILLDRMEHT